GRLVDQVEDRDAVPEGVVQRRRNGDELLEDVENPDRDHSRPTVLERAFFEDERDPGTRIERIGIVLLQTETALTVAHLGAASRILTIKRYGKDTERKEDDTDATPASHRHLRT